MTKSNCGHKKRTDHTSKDMRQYRKTIVEKLLYFAEIGEKYRVPADEMQKIAKELRKIKTKRRFRWETSEAGFSLIWRTK